MCGIWAHVLCDGHNDQDGPIELSKDAAAPIQKRGPDIKTTVTTPWFSMAFNRLAINGLHVKGNQPFSLTTPDGDTIYLMCNGEIYNYKSLVQKYDLTLESSSDCEVLIHLLAKFWDSDSSTFESVLREIEGEYAIVAVRESDKNGKNKEVFVARDPFGVRPLYWSKGSTATATSEEEVGTEESHKGLIFSSLLSGIAGIAGMGTGIHFPPGHYLKTNTASSSSSIVPVRFYQGLGPEFMSKIPTPDADNGDIRDNGNTNMQDYYLAATQTLIAAVSARMQSDRPVGFLLSGGLDSSLVVGIAARILKTHENIKTFSVGMQGSSDLAYARQVADFLGTDHTEVVFTPEEALAIIPEVIRCLETYDITTIRASIGSFLLAKHVREHTDIKVLLNGDGSDEVACGYLYNYYAPSPEEAHADAINRLEEIHMYDGLRVDRTISNHGLEARVPFLDPRYVEAYLSIPDYLRVPGPQNMEKKLLRDAFFLLYPDVLPKDVLYRRKEAFSDGVSAKSDGRETMIQRIKRWTLETHNMPEPDYYKQVFNEAFPGHEHIIPGYWMPRWTGAETNDPSATTLKIY